MHLRTLCAIFGARPSYRRTTSSSVSLAWMCSREDAGDDAILHGGSIIYIYRVRGRHRVKCTEAVKKKGAGRQRGFWMGREREMKAHTLGGWVEVQYMHVDLGFRCPCVKKRKRSPLRFYLPTWFTAPVTYNEKRKWVSMMKYIITTHLMDQNSQRWNTENISKPLFMYLCHIYNIAIMNINARSWNYIAF